MARSMLDGYLHAIDQPILADVPAPLLQLPGSGSHMRQVIGEKEHIDTNNWGRLSWEWWLSNSQFFFVCCVCVHLESVLVGGKHKGRKARNFGTCPGQYCEEVVYAFSCFSFFFQKFCARW